MSACWIVTVEGRAYGPYTPAQMAAFAAEGRIAPQSLISRTGEATCRPAASFTELAGLFAPQAEETGESAESQPRVEARSAAVFGRNKDDGPKTGEPFHLVIMADVKSRSINALEEAICKFGQVIPILPQIWLLRTDQSVNSVRTVLAKHMGSVDMLFIVDATNDKAAWHNFMPHAEARIRRFWSRTQETSPAARATG